MPAEPIPSILIVDDAPANLELLAEMLRNQGYEPRPVPSGKLALLAAKAEPPDLILLDINMPEMDGFAVCERLKADDALKDIPVIFITAYSDVADKVKAFSMGAVDYITKPFQFEEVQARVETHLRLRALQRQLRLQNENLEQMLAERTRKLYRAHERLLELDQVKDDFLTIISHEIRTPANGILGIGELILDLCGNTEEGARYRELFMESSQRLRNLIDDATMLASMNKVSPASGEAELFVEVFGEAAADVPNLQIIRQAQQPAAVFLRGDCALLKRALTTLLQLAASFSPDRRSLKMVEELAGQTLLLQFPLGSFTLPASAAEKFFDLESPVRSASPAETLGLAPVVAYRIIAAFGGSVDLVKDEGGGRLEVRLAVDAHAG